jgi:hypothetical protein
MKCVNSSQVVESVSRMKAGNAAFQQQSRADEPNETHKTQHWHEDREFVHSSVVHHFYIVVVQVDGNPSRVFQTFDFFDIRKLKLYEDNLVI